MGVPIKKKRSSTPLFIWLKKTFNQNGQEVKNTDKIMFKYRYYDKIEERGELVCYKLRQ